jgi:hypothetical protein
MEVPVLDSFSVHISDMTQSSKIATTYDPSQHCSFYPPGNISGDH